MKPVDEQPDRRKFLRNAMLGLLGLLGAAFISVAAGALAPVRSRRRETVFFPLLPEEELPRSGVRKTELAYESSGRQMKTRVFIVAASDTLTAFSAVCSHLGCFVNYRRTENEFVCPCHNGRYNIEGKNIAGPPSAPLTRFPVRIENGVVLVGLRV